MAEAVKQEQTEGETVSLDNMKDLKGKKGANLIVKILAMVLMPMLVIIFFAMLALKAVGNNTAETLVKEELAATEYAMQLNLDSASGEGFRYENGSLCKGEINFTENQSFFQNFTSNTNVDVVLFWDKEAAAASFDYSGIVLSDSVASKVLAGGYQILCISDTDYRNRRQDSGGSGSGDPGGARERTVFRHCEIQYDLYVCAGTDLL